MIEKIQEKIEIILSAMENPTSEGEQTFSPSHLAAKDFLISFGAIKRLNTAELISRKTAVIILNKKNEPVAKPSAPPAYNPKPLKTKTNNENQTTWVKVYIMSASTLEILKSLINFRKRRAEIAATPKPNAALKRCPVSINSFISSKNSGGIAKTPNLSVKSDDRKINELMPAEARHHVHHFLRLNAWMKVKYKENKKEKVVMADKKRTA